MGAKLCSLVCIRVCVRVYVHVSFKYLCSGPVIEASWKSTIEMQPIGPSLHPSLFSLIVRAHLQ